VRGDYQAANIASVVASAFGKKKRKISDFLMKFEYKKRPSAEEVERKARAILSRFDFGTKRKKRRAR